MRKSTTGVVFAAALALCSGSPRRAEAGPCIRYKLDAVSVVTSAKLACHAAAAGQGSSVDPNCLTAANDALASAFDRADGAGGCDLIGDAAAVAVEVDGLVTAVVDVVRPVPDANPCAGAKLRAAGDASERRMRCHIRGERTGGSIAARCVNRARDALMRAFVAAEAVGPCLTVGDGGAVHLLLAEGNENAAGMLRVVRRLSVTSTGRSPRRPNPVVDRISHVKGTLAPNGRVVSFFSNLDSLVPGDENDNDIFDTFVHDVVAGTTEIASVSSDGAAADGDPGAFAPFSSDGRYLAFDSNASTLAPTDPDNWPDVFLRDRLLGTTEHVSVAPGPQGVHTSVSPSLSADARFVAFQSSSTNLVPGDTNNCSDIFLRDRLLASTARVSVRPDGAQANGESAFPVLTPDASVVVLISQSTNLVPGIAGGIHMYLKDLVSGGVEAIDVATDGTPGNFEVYGFLAVSADARYVAFTSIATNLVAGDTNGVEDVFLRDRVADTTARISVGPGATQGNGGSRMPSISADGRFVAFSSDASNLVANDTNGASDVFVLDRATSALQRVSRAADGTQGNDMSSQPSLSPDGRRVVFWSQASNLVRRDTNGRYLGFDVFLRAVRW